MSCKTHISNFQHLLRKTCPKIQSHLWVILHLAHEKKTKQNKKTISEIHKEIRTVLSKIYNITPVTAMTETWTRPTGVQHRDICGPNTHQCWPPDSPENVAIGSDLPQNLEKDEIHNLGIKYKNPQKYVFPMIWRNFVYLINYIYMQEITHVYIYQTQQSGGTLCYLWHLTRAVKTDPDPALENGHLSLRAMVSLTSQLRATNTQNQ